MKKGMSFTIGQGSRYKPFFLSILSLGLTLALSLFLLPQTAMAEGPQVDEAQTYQIIDQDGHVLAEKNPDQRMDPASITKVMTAMVALDQGKDLDQTYTLKQLPYQADAQIAGIKEGDTLTLRQIMMVMLVYSANDAADNAAIATVGSTDEFVKKMNEKAQEIGMTNTHFMNTHGLMAEGHYSTAADLTKMAKYALEHYPFIAQAVRTSSYTVTIGGVERTYYSTDKLMATYDGLVGIKTGAVESGCAFLGASMRSGVRLYSAVLGCKTNAGRFGDTAKLMDWSYANAYTRSSFTKKQLPIRVANWALGFGPKVVIYSNIDSTGLVYPGENIQYSVSIPSTDLLVDLGGGYGTAVWSQGKHKVCYQTYGASKQLAYVPNVSIFALPLFA